MMPISPEPTPRLMKTLIKKEIRLLMPAWVTAMLLAVISPWIFPASYAGQQPLNPLFHFLFPLGALFLGITSFGMEFNSGTFTIPLSQPMDRRLIWKIKTTTLFIAFLAVWIAAVVSILCRFSIGSEYLDNAFQRFGWESYKFDSLEILTLSSLAAFSGGLWTTLLVRQMTGAFWVTLLTPLAVLVGVETLAGIWIASDWVLNAVLITSLTTYSIAGFCFARWLFFHAQDTQWAGGSISFAWPAGAKSKAASRTGAPGHWITALVWKEVHLHQANIFLAGVLLIFQLSCLAALRIYPHLSSDARFALKSVWIIWLLMPLVIGSSVIAEERRLGVSTTQLCLPASRIAQYFVKFSVALILSLLFGGMIPFAITAMEGADSNFHLLVAVFSIYPIAMSFVSIYASSLVRSTLLAIGTAMAIAAILWATFAAAVTWNFGRLFFNHYDDNQITGLLLVILFVGAPVLFVVFGRLTFWNFKWLHEDSTLWRRNIIAAFATLATVIIFTNAIYFRAWESVTTIEPVPGPARLGDATDLKFGSVNTLFAILPGGRLWSDSMAYHTVSNLWWQTIALAPKNNVSSFIGGSNWTQFCANNLQALGIQSDGTLWSVQTKWDPTRNSRRQSGPFTVAQIGPDTDWRQVSGGRSGFLLLKRDGSLWQWGTNYYDWKKQTTSIPKKLANDRAMMPSRIGNGTDWLDLFSSGEHPYAKKRDGSLWRWAQRSDLDAKSMLVPVSEINTNGPWSSVSFLGGDSFVEIKTNGEFWFAFTRYGSPETKNKPNLMRVRLGGNAKWKACRISWQGVWAIRDDGTLWKWPPVWFISDKSDLNPTQCGNRSDWLSLSDSWDFEVGLAADGSLWAWGEPSLHIWLAPSRKPVYLGNLFTEADDADQPATHTKTHENAN
jgi:hypothetical protein